MCYSQASEAKNASCRDRWNSSFPRQLQRGVEHVLLWCESSSAEQPTVYIRLAAMTQVFQRSRKKTSHKEALELKTRQNNCKPGTMSKQKFAFQLLSTHVLFPNITSKKCQMQRPERTGNFHANSKEEWNIIHDGVNHRVQSSRHFTQDLRQWHKSSTEAEKKTSHKEALGLTTRQITVERKRFPKQNSPFIYVAHMCYSQTSQAKNARCRDRREQVNSTSTPKRSGT